MRNVAGQSCQRHTIYVMIMSLCTPHIAAENTVKAVCSFRVQTLYDHVVDTCIKAYNQANVLPVCMQR